jgi:hypothetical protein
VALVRKTTATTLGAVPVSAQGDAEATLTVPAGLRPGRYVLRAASGEDVATTALVVRPGKPAHRVR